MQETINILAFESSCDDTSVALVQGKRGDAFPRCLSFSLQSQNEIHEKYGGVVPDLAAREHLRNIVPCLNKVLNDTQVKLEEIDAFAATNQPGLISCLLVGHTAAKTLSFIYEKPFISCHHIHSHLLSIFLEYHPSFPHLTLIASGGHTSLYVVKSLDDFECVGVTLDDAAGEAFDKGAKVLGLGFPGGPELDLLAKKGNSQSYVFSQVKVSGFNFSFSGLKSEFARLCSREGKNLHKANAAASYQKALVSHLLQKIKQALKKFSMEEVIIVGGVARNSLLRQSLEELKKQNEIKHWYAPSPHFCTDNAAMVGVFGYRKFIQREWSPLSDSVFATERLSRKEIQKVKI